MIVPNPLQGDVVLYNSKDSAGTDKVAFDKLTPLNVKDPVDGTVVAKHVTEVRLLQPSKALLPMLVTELGMVMEVRLLEPWKAPSPMLVTELGMVTEVRLLQ